MTITQVLITGVHRCESHTSARKYKHVLYTDLSQSESTMRSILQSGTEVKEFEGVLPPGGEDRSILERKPSAPSGPSGGSAPILPVPNLDGLNALNSPATDAISTKPADSVDSGASLGSFPALVGLSDLKGVNRHKQDPMSEILSEFRKYKYKLAHTPCVLLHLRNRTDNSEVIYKANSRSQSRYFPEGRAAIQRNIRDRLAQSRQPGVFLTLTVAASDWDIMESWAVMWQHFGACRRALTMHRKRTMNAKHSALYLAALEPHQSGYPHMHVFYPGLKWLVKKADLHKMDDWWKMGSVRTEKERREESACSYVLKYVSKLDGWSESSQALLWAYRLRLYNLSHRFYKSAPGPEWEKIGQYSDVGQMRKGLKVSATAADAIIDSDENFIYVKTPLV